MNDNSTTGSPSPSKRKGRKAEEPVVYSPLVVNPPALGWDDEHDYDSAEEKKSFGARAKVKVKSVFSPSKKTQSAETEMTQYPSSVSPAKRDSAAAPSSSYTQVGDRLVAARKINFDPDAEPEFDASLDEDEPLDGLFISDDKPAKIKKAEKASTGIGAQMKALTDKVKNIDKDPIACGIALIIIGGVLAGAGSAIGGPANPLGSAMIALGTAVGIIGVALLAIGFVLKLMDLYGKYSEGKNKAEVVPSDESSLALDEAISTEPLLLANSTTTVFGR